MLALKAGSPAGAVVDAETFTVSPAGTAPATAGKEIASFPPPASVRLAFVPAAATGTLAEPAAAVGVGVGGSETFDPLTELPLHAVVKSASPKRSRQNKRCDRMERTS
jgi:hypothetical protein